MKHLAVFLALAAAVATSACKNDDEVTVVGAASAQPTASAVPVDHLATGELLEGSAKAFGLVLPRGVRIDAAFSDVVYASGPAHRALAAAIGARFVEVTSTRRARPPRS